MTDALIGHTGFVGGNLRVQHEFGACYNSKNISEIQGHTFDTIVFAGAQAKKWWANENPEKDRAGIENAIGNLRLAEAKRLIIISTIDVLPPNQEADEKFNCTSFKNHAYGENRLYLENQLAGIFDDVYIFRLPGLFGSGLKKNVIFDLLNDNLLEKINPESSFQFYDLSCLWADIQKVCDANVRLIHLFPAPVKTSKIINEFFAGKIVGADPAPVAHYNYKTAYDYLFGRSDGFIYGEDEILNRLARFIANYKV